MAIECRIKGWTRIDGARKGSRVPPGHAAARKGGDVPLKEGGDRTLRGLPENTQDVEATYFSSLEGIEPGNKRAKLSGMEEGAPCSSFGSEASTPTTEPVDVDFSEELLDALYQYQQVV